MSNDNVTIIFAGKSIACRPDTSIGVALLENGVRHISHSHKYGKPRGLTCARGHCTSCLMRVDGVPNVRTCQTPVRDGMVVEIQDAGAFYGAPMQKMLSIGGNLFPVGFYYKWFTKPTVLSRFFLDQIRPLTGVGKLPAPSAASLALPEGKEVEVVPAKELGNLGTLIIGAGPSGLAAALGCDGPVTIIDDHQELGGQRAGALEILNNLPGAPFERFKILMAAHKDLESLVLDRATIQYKDVIALKYAELVYDGLWFSPLKEAIDAFVDSTQGPVTGMVRLKLYKGNIISAGSKSPFSLYREDFATFGQEDVYDQSDAKGFINIYGLSLKVRALNKLPISGLGMPKPDYSRFKRD